MRIRLLQRLFRSGDKGTLHMAGEIVDVPDTLAASLVARGHAQSADKGYLLRVPGKKIILPAADIGFVPRHPSQIVKEDK